MARARQYREWTLQERLPSQIEPARARDILLDCFATVHGPHYEATKKHMGVSATKEDVRRSVKGIMRIAFRQAKGDFDHPDRESLERVVEYLGEKSRTWGTPEPVIARHSADIQRVLMRVSQSN